MKDRIRQIMESKHMTQQVFADFIGINAATLSGIYNNRTNPSLNIVEAIKKKFPDISLDWLIFDRGDMYLSQAASTPTTVADQSGASPSVSTVQQPMFDFVTHPASSDQVSAPSPTPQSAQLPMPPANSVRSTRQDIAREEVKCFDTPKRHITEIRVYYDDQTWESFVPSKK